MFYYSILETDFSAYLHNVNLYKSFLKPNTKLMAVVKASGYGTGAVRLAKFFESIDVDYLAVAFTEEGIELRKAGISKPIVIFNPNLKYLDEIIENDLEPAIYDLSQFNKLKSRTGQKIKIHIKLDTGMKRLGFVDSEIDSLIEEINLSNVKIVSIFSHLAASEDENKDDFTIKQVELFSKLYNEIQNNLSYEPIKHTLNSSGIVRFSKYQFDMVRLGIGMHSDDLSGEISSRLKPVHTLKAPISQLKNIPANDGIGYGNKCKKNHNRTIAILPIGYADGFHRQAGNGKYKVWINGSFVPIIGNINMDMIFVDVTEIKDVKIGDMVEVFGKHAKITDLAKSANTITYELLTRVSSRVKRIYK